MIAAPFIAAVAFAEWHRRRHTLVSRRGAPK
jgi:hypothetical protein